MIWSHLPEGVRQQPVQPVMLITLALLIVPLVVALTQDDERSSLLAATIEAVIEPASNATHGIRYSYHQHQVYQRLEGIPPRYYYQSEDADSWLSLLRKDDASGYARLAAASLLYHDSGEARRFIDEYLVQEDVRLRNNAAVALARAIRKRGDEAWQKSLKLVEDRILEQAPPAEQEEARLRSADARDIESPLAHVCYTLCMFCDMELMPLFLEKFEQQKDDFHSAQLIAHGIALMDRKQASECLLQLLGTHDDVIGDVTIVYGLARIGDNSVVPKLCELLNADQAGKSKNMAITLHSHLLDALKILREQRAIPEIEKFLNGGVSEFVESRAKTTIEALQDDDRLATLLDAIELKQKNGEQVGNVVMEIASVDDNMSVLPALEDIAENSPYLQDRLMAVAGIAQQRSPEAVYALATLIGVEFPGDLILPEIDREETSHTNEILKAEIARYLRAKTNHNYGFDSTKWVEYALKLDK